MQNVSRYLTASQVRTRFGNISSMSLWRWEQDEELGFPKPLIIKGRKFYPEDEIAKWELDRRAGAAA